MYKKFIIFLLFILIGFLLFNFFNAEGGSGQTKLPIKKSNDNLTKEIIDNGPQLQGDLSSIISKQISQLSIDEKIGQMIFAGVSGTKPNAETDRLINDYRVGGFIFNGKNLSSPSQTVAYINDLKEKNHKTNKTPLFFGIDQEGGRISKLPGDLVDIPTNLEIGKVNNPSFSFELGSILGKMVHAYGFNINFAPVLDINSNPKNPVIGDRSFGDNSKIVSELGTQMMKGIQSESIIPTIKHFPGHGDTSVDSHLELPTVHKSLAELEKLELNPFRHAIDEGADMVMVAHLMLPQIDQQFPSSLSKVMMTEILRNQMGFDGVIITDDLTMEAVAGNFDLGNAAVLSVKAGTDIVMVAHDYEKIIKVISALKKAVEDGVILEERINESVKRILLLKEKYRITDSISKEVNINEQNQLIQSVLNKFMK